IVNQIWLLEETGNKIDEYKTYYLYSFAEKKYWCKDEFNQTDGLDGYSLYGNIGFNASLTTDKSKAMEVTILKSGSSPSWRTDDGNQGNEGYIIACNKENNRCYKLGEKDFNVAMQYSNDAVVWSFYETTEANEYLLTGTPIGSISVDYNNGNTRSTTTNTPAMAFDDDYSTIYASYDRFYTYVGLDLEEKHVITKIEYAPRKNYQSRMVLGVFEGANNSDFSDAVPLFTIKDAPEYDKMTPAEINCSRGFRYVRYVGPNDVRCNVSELKFYGHKSEGNDSKLYQMTNIPLLVIHTENAKDVTSKSNYVYGIISVISNNGKTIFTDSLGIKGRGNASWDFPKKPYKIKLFNKTKLLGMPSKAKEWTLINNYGDKSLLRNILAMETSRRFDMEYTPSVRLVNVMLNGEYKGTYQLFDQIEIRKNRIDIDELTPDIVDGEELTGGYHIEIDAYASGSEKFTSKRGMPISLKEPDPEDINEQQRNYIKNVFDDMESSVFSTDYQNPVNGYRSRLDIDSFLKYFLIQEFSGNTDGYWSVHMYKKRGDIKLYSGPIWDFDLAFENDARTHPINSLTEYLSLSGRSSAASGMKELLRRIVNDNKQEITECWSNARNYNNLNKEYFNNFIDSLVQEIDQSQELNYMRWNILSSKVHQNFQALGDYHKEIDYLKNWIQERFDWMDNKIGLLEKRVDVTYLALSETELDIKENTKADLIVTTLPEDATHKELIWSSSNPDVAIVKDGSITALTAGTSIITATTTDGTDISASCKVNVYSIDIDEFGIVSVRGKLSNSNIDEVKALTDITAVNLTNADISGLIADDLQFGQNILTTVSPDSHIHGVNIINNGVCDNLLLIDNLSFAPISQFMANNVSFTKTMYEGWNTLVLPFSTDIPERVKAYAFTKATDTTLIFKEITQQIPANTPIICKTEDGISSNVTFVSESVPIELSDFKDADFVGTYNTLSKSYTYGKYVISDNREYFNLSNGDVSIPAFNCYYESNNTNIHFSDEPIRGYARAESGILYIVIEDITGVAKHKVQYLSHGDIFNLQGVKVESEGINIKGKKKYIK
ncbi:MAG: CotH kinase family protein, partial [Prevotellaceae bacterium]|nr:CotH kinase family protein [Candidatus Faecinaster equi]